MYWPWLVQKGHLNAKVDLPFDNYHAYFCAYAFEPLPNAYAVDGELVMLMNVMNIGRQARYTETALNLIFRLDALA